MKDRQVKSRKRVEARSVSRHDVVELNGQRLRVDQKRKVSGGRIALRQIPTGTGPTRSFVLSPTKKLELIRR
jgi:hypothetical protein